MLTLLLVSAPAALAAQGDSADGSAPPTAPAEEARRPEGIELPEERTARSDTYELPNGARETQIYEAPVNFKDEGGDWKPIETELHEAQQGPGIANGANSFDLLLPETMGEEAVRVAEEGQWVSCRLLGSSAELAELDGEEATYETASGAVAFDLSSIPTGVKESIVLEDPSAPQSFAFELNASDGLVPKLAEDGSLHLEDRHGKTFALLPAPSIADASGIASTSTDAVSYSLADEADGGWRVTLTADPQWLADPERAWPVTIDPSVEVASAPYEGVIGANPPPSGWGVSGTGYANLPAAYIPNSPETTRYLVRFDLAAVPAGAAISSATLKLYSPATAENTPGIEARQLTSPANVGSNWQLTHNFSGQIGYWKTPGGDFDPAVGAVVKTSERGSGPGWWNFESESLNDLVADWKSGLTQNFGFIVKQTDETNAGLCSPAPPNCQRRYAEWYSSTGPASYRPKLAVKWWPSAPAQAKVTSPTDGTVTARRLRLQAGWESGITQVKAWQYRVGKSGIFRDIPGEALRDGEGQAVSLPETIVSGVTASKAIYLDASQLSSTLRKKGGELQLRARFGEAEGVSAPVAVKVDPALGGPKDATAGVGPGSVDLLTGNFTVTETDVSIPAFNSSLDFSRTFSSRDVVAPGNTGPLGPGWKPGVPVEEEGAGEWRSVKLVTETEEEFSFTYAVVTDIEGAEIAFEKEGGSYKTPPELTGWSLTAPSSGEFVLTTPDGTKTTFNNSAVSPSEYLPGTVTQTGGPNNQTRMAYEIDSASNKRRLALVVAPAAPNISCGGSPNSTPGCKTLQFLYKPASTWGAPASYGERLYGIWMWAPGILGGPVQVAEYTYDASGRLKEAWDPRISPALKETYTYNSDGQIETITPPGQKPWTMEYKTLNEEEVPGRLKAVKRDSLVAGTAQTTIAYGVPTSGSGAPYPMGRSDVAKWGQTDVPVDATAVFPPDQVPLSSPPSSYSRATVYYMDPDGNSVNTATPSGAGTEAASISTAETDVYGNVVRELTPQNRLRALAAGSGSAAKSHELETKRIYGAEGTQLETEEGPTHQTYIVDLGETKAARSYTVTKYDQEIPHGPPGPKAPSPDPHLPTESTTGAKVGAAVYDQRTTKTKYNWTLLKPIETIIDPGSGHLEIKSVVSYDENTGLPTETRQPKSSGESASAGTTKTVYYTAGTLESLKGCVINRYVGLPCKTEPGAQAEGSGRPKLLTKRFTAYNALSEPTEIIESPGGEEANQRKTLITYDAAGRKLTSEIQGGGVPVPKTETSYSPTQGMPTGQRFACSSGCSGSPTYATSFGSSGTGNGQFKGPTGAAIDAAGNLWVADSQNNRVEKFNSKGEFLLKFGSYGTGNGQFHGPQGVAVDPAGNIWVTDAGNNRVEKFNSKGEYLLKFGGSGTGNGQFSGPEAIAVDSKGNAWVADTYNNRVQKVNEKGEFIKVVGAGLMDEDQGIAVGPGNNVFVSNAESDEVLVFNEAGEKIDQWGESGSGEGQLKGASELTIDPAGTVWVTDIENSRVVGFTQDGEFVGQFGAWGSAGGLLWFGEFTGIASDAEGNLFVTDTMNDRTQKWNKATVTVDTQATYTRYDALGRPVEYKDADGNTATTAYDLDGRPVRTSDNKGSQMMSYDPTSGLPVKLEDSAAGTFTAAYDAEGNMTQRTLPNGITATTTYNEVDEPMSLAYTKTSYCGKTCTWLSETLERSVFGQITSIDGTLVKDAYLYDKAGRLTEARETPTDGECTTRAYSFDADSNRTAMATRAPGVGGVCVTTGGTPQSYTYDAADRLEGPTYDSWGRITSLPASFAGGKALETKYFSTDMVAEQTQDGVSNVYQLDASLRQHQRVQGGGLEGVEVLHYDGPGDSVAWTKRGSVWSRSIGGIGGELAAIQESGSPITFQLTNLHGDVEASAEASPTATKLKATYRFDEFGNPMSGTAGRFGWLGGKARRTELASGVIQMGARSYVPALGRFITPDPIIGGSANPYDYVDQDPVNGFDLMGTCHDVKGHRVCPGKKERRELHRALVRAEEYTVREERRRHMHVGCQNYACTVRGVARYADGSTGPTWAFKMGESAIHYISHHMTQINSGALGGFSYFLASRFGHGDFIQGCVKDSSDAFHEDQELIQSKAGIAVAVPHVVASCIGGALGG